jgi:hypothetical protein
MAYLYNILGIIMAIWYVGIRWIFCEKEKWLFNPINFTTAIMSIIFIIPTVFIEEKTLNYGSYCVAVFLWMRNLIYMIEDVIDIMSFPTERQLSYVILDILMLAYVSLWIIKFIKG